MNELMRNQLTSMKDWAFEEALKNRYELIASEISRRKEYYSKLEQVENMRLFTTVMTFIILIMLILFSFNIVNQNLNLAEQQRKAAGGISLPDEDDEEQSLLRSFRGDSVILVKNSKCQNCHHNRDDKCGTINRDIQLIEVESGQTGETSDLIMESYEFKLNELGAKQSTPIQTKQGYLSEDI